MTNRQITTAIVTCMLSISLNGIGTVGISWSAPQSDGEASEAEVALAKQYFVLGKTYYDQGAYEKALEAFQESYRHSQRPALLYNIAKCHESLGQIEPAIDNYQRFLDESGKSNPSIKARIRNLKRRLEQTKPATPSNDQPKTTTTTPPKPAKQPTPTVKPIQVPQKTPQKKPVSTAFTKPTQTDHMQSDKHAAEWMKWTGWTLVGVGAAAVATSVIMGLLAADKARLMEDAYACASADAPDNCPVAGRAYDFADVKAIEDDGKRFEAAQIATLVVGIVSAGAGTTLLILAPRYRKVASLVTPMFAKGTMGLSTSIEF